MFFVVKKRQLILVALLILSIICAVFCSYLASDQDAVICRKFKKELGYNPESLPYETAEMTIPEGFGSVYRDYNDLQKQAGFDLTSYRGTDVTRYSFHLSGEEYPIANILISDGKICGGDLLDPSLSGKIAPLIPKEKE